MASGSCLPDAVSAGPREPKMRSLSQNGRASSFPALASEVVGGSMDSMPWTSDAGRELTSEKLGNLASETSEILASNGLQISPPRPLI